MISDERRQMEEFDRRRAERIRLLDDQIEYRDTDGYKAKKVADKQTDKKAKE